MPNKLLKSLAVVLPRYGEALGGGAEALVKSFVDKFHRDSLVERIEVWTTCAADHRTWENSYKAGEYLVNGVKTRRFPVSPRNLQMFVEKEVAMREGVILSIEEQLDWLENSVNSLELYSHIAEHGREFDMILFAPYLFGTSFWGPLIYPERSVLLPCLHNEHYAYQDVFRVVFEKVKGIIFNAHAEKELAKSIYQLDAIEEKSAVIGMAFSGVTDSQLDIANIKTGEGQSLLQNKYILYSGRKERGKNVDTLIKAFSAYQEWHSDSNLQLVLIGAGDLDFMERLPDGVIDLGFRSEAQKNALMQNALFLCQPSENESFSIVIMEAWLQGVPVVVSANCAVTREHVISSGGGLYFSTKEEFSEIVDLLCHNGEFRKKLGECGKEYVEKTYSWDAVLERFREFVSRVK